MAAEAFADWTGDGGSETGDAAVLPQSARLNIVPRPRAPQSELRIGQVSVARDTPDYHPLVVANTILGGQFVSRINLNLREDKGLTYGARTAFEFRRRRGHSCCRSACRPAARPRRSRNRSVRSPASAARGR